MNYPYMSLKRARIAKKLAAAFDITMKSAVGLLMFTR